MVSGNLTKQVIPECAASLRTFELTKCGCVPRAAIRDLSNWVLAYVSHPCRRVPLLSFCSFCTTWTLKSSTSPRIGSLERFGNIQLKLCRSAVAAVKCPKRKVRHGMNLMVQAPQSSRTGHSSGCLWLSIAKTAIGLQDWTMGADASERLHRRLHVRLA